MAHIPTFGEMTPTAHERQDNIVSLRVARQSHRTSNEPCLCNLYDEIASYSNGIFSDLRSLTQ